MVQSDIDGNLGKGIVWGRGVDSVPRNPSILNTIFQMVYPWLIQSWTLYFPWFA